MAKHEKFFQKMTLAKVGLREFIGQLIEGKLLGRWGGMVPAVG
jgi:hypothetical protein